MPNELFMGIAKDQKRAEGIQQTTVLGPNILPIVPLTEPSA